MGFARMRQGRLNRVLQIDLQANQTHSLSETPPEGVVAQQRGLTPYYSVL
jgi:hypothetical protein